MEMRVENALSTPRVIKLIWMEACKRERERDTERKMAKRPLNL